MIFKQNGNNANDISQYKLHVAVLKFHETYNEKLIT